MLALPHTNSWGFVYTNQENGSSTLGTSVTPGTSSAEGSWAQIASAANIAADVNFVMLLVTLGESSGQSKQHFLDLGWDPAGGSSYTAFCQDFACGGSRGPAFSMGIPFEFPCKIPAGSTVAARVQGSNATAGSFRVWAYFFGKPSRPELWRNAAYSETLGAGASTLGTSFTPGNASWGAWASLGTTTKKHFWTQLGVQLNNNTQTGHYCRVQVGIGDGTNMHVIADRVVVTSNGEACWHSPQHGGAWEIPAGAELWVRGNNSAAPDSGYNATAVLFGG